LWPISLLDFTKKKNLNNFFSLLLFTLQFVPSNRIYIANGNDIDIPTIHITIINNIQTPKRIRERNG